jgi:hypothetical protein
MKNDTRKRPSPGILSKIQDYIARLQAEVDEVKKVVKLKDSEDWEIIREIIVRKSSGIDFDLDNFQSLSDKDMYCSLQTRKDLKFFLSLIEGGERALEDLNLKIEKAKDDLIEYTKRFG